MPARRVNRIQEEQAEFEQERRERNAASHRLKRQEKRQSLLPQNYSIQTRQANNRAQHAKNVRSSRDKALKRNLNEALQEHQRNENSKPSFSNLDVSKHFIGDMDILCIHCNAKHFAMERISKKGNSFNDCCSHGAVKLKELPKFPHELEALLDGTHEKSNIFFNRIRVYNSSLAFASFNANLVNFSNRRPGPWCFKIQGQIYYQINTALYPKPGEIPSHGQLFIVDPEEANLHRTNTNSGIDSEIMKSLDKMMRDVNIFASSYKMMHEELEAQSNNGNTPQMRLLFNVKPGMDIRRYNPQRSNEVAAVFSTTADGEIPDSYVAIRNINTKELTNVSTINPNVEPWIYPILFPFGNEGWDSELKRVIGLKRRVSRSAYAKYRIAVRPNVFNPFILGRRLFQQWVVDTYVKVEKDRFNFCKENQKKLRSESYQGLMDHLENAANDINGQVGKVVILPSTFIGSPRNMQQNYQDAMAIVRKFGKPDLFLTMTCNPNWREIKDNLLPGQTPADRPDLIARVFNLKKDHLIELVVKKFFFGKVAGYVYVIEFQKRGLPHMHLLITLGQEYKLTTPNLVDAFISAEIPSPEQHGNLNRAVLQHMIHGPCGDWCTVNNKCSKHFPFDYQVETTLDADSYPQYKRRNTGASYQKSNYFVVDNRNVVPYNPTLLLLFDCHINVVAVSSVKSVKYLFKYIYKGHDAAAITVGDSTGDTTQSEKINHDEIQDFVEARYVGPTEACWRILSKPLHDRSHSIIRLQIHLPNQQNIMIDDDADDQMIRNALTKITMLNDYFALNARDEFARNLLYVDIPDHYIFKKPQGNNEFKWVRRARKCDVIGRMYAISPTQVELFHLRLLLLHRKGITSFIDMKKVDDITHPTFVDTCIALAIIEDDDEWSKAMEEGCLWMMPCRLRCLFVRILIHCQPLYPEKLWLNFKIQMSEDYARNDTTEIAEKKTYTEINQMLIAEGKSLSDFPTMEQLIDNFPDNKENSLEDNKITAQQKYEMLNSDQKPIVDMVIAMATDQNTNDLNKLKLIYIDGPGGTGKTFIYTTIYHMMKTAGKKVCCMAFTGIAAILLPYGKTVHKTFGLPVPMYSDSVTNIKMQSNEASELRATDIFIWDEAPMAPRYALEIVDRALQNLMENNLPFGGKIFILGGDFRQLLPVKPKATRTEIVNLCIQFSHLWHHFQRFTLTKNMRVNNNDDGFKDFLLQIGEGKLNEHDNIPMPSLYIAPPNANIVDDIYGNLIKAGNFNEFANRAILAPRNVEVDQINKQVVSILDGPEYIYTSVDSTENCDNGDMTQVLLPEYLNSLCPNGLPPNELILRKNCVVMLIRNISAKEGLCNGTRLRIIDFSNHLLKCQILTGDKTGNIVFIHRITLYCENEYPFTFKRRQFPIKLAFAMTINKAQGQTFKKIGINLDRDVFSHGHLYVAMSRVRSQDGVKIYRQHLQANDPQSHVIIKNYVYSEVFC